jgi:beta-glucosidase
MPYYGMPVGVGLEEVGFGFNRGVVTDLLRDRFGFDGIVCTDFRVLTDQVRDGEVLVQAACWGVEHLSVSERVKKIIDAGCDQIGGESCPEVIVDLVRSAQLSRARIDQSARRLLREKFRLGLFDNPYVDADCAAEIVGNAQFQQAGQLAQRRAITLLQDGGNVLPLRQGVRAYVEGVDLSVARDYADVVDSPDDAEVAIVRLAAPYEQRNGSFLESRFHAGDLDFKEPERTRILDLLRRVPTIVDIYLDRPAVIPELAEHSAALLADFGADDAAVLDVVFGKYLPAGRLPFELPSSMESVRRQKEDVPFDSEQPLFPFGHGVMAVRK